MERALSSSQRAYLEEGDAVGLDYHFARTHKHEVTERRPKSPHVGLDWITIVCAALLCSALLLRAAAECASSYLGTSVHKSTVCLDLGPESGAAR